ncbi:MAG: hypothetical protein KDC12_10700 [Flavobacteriales bacterium]|nr:hypothetical protein [Flavobacteriales bacterium]
MFHRLISVVFLLAGIASAGWVYYRLAQPAVHAVDPVFRIPKEVETVARLNTAQWTHFGDAALFLKQSLPENCTSLSEFLSQLDSARKSDDRLQQLLNYSALTLALANEATETPSWALYYNAPDHTSWLDVILTKSSAAHIQSGSSYMITNDTARFNPAFRASQADSTWLSMTRQWGESPLNIAYRNGSKGEAFDLVIENGIFRLVGTHQKSTLLTSNPYDRVELYNLLSGLPARMDQASGWLGAGGAFAKWRQAELAASSELAPFNGKLADWENTCNCPVQDLMFDNLAHWAEVASGDHVIYITQVKGLKDRFDEYQPLLGNPSETYKEYTIFTPESFGLVPYYLTPKSNASENWYVTTSENLLIFSSSLSSLQWYINQLVSGRVFAFEAGCIQLMESLVNREGFFIYGDSQLSPLQHLNAGWPTERILNQQCAAGSSIYQSYTWMGAASSQPAAHKGWSVMLDHRLSQVPAIVRNHYTGAKEVFIQDDANTVHLIDEKGRVLWSKSLKGKIISEVAQVDLFKNGKLQLIFNTKKEIVCLDRNGNAVEGFPIKLPSDATSPLAVFDYDNDRDYRLVIGCANGELYNYKADGKATRGWKFKKAGSPVLALEHVKVKTKDYIFALEKDGTIHLLQRNGVSRYDAKAVARHYGGGGYHILKGNSIESSRLIYPDTLGNIVIARFDQKQNESGLTGFSAGSRVVVADVTGDGREDFIVADGKELSVYNHAFERMFSAVHDGPINHLPKVYKFSEVDYKIGLCVPETGELYLYNIRGEMDPAFPIKGSGPYSISDLNGDGQLEVIGFHDHGEVFDQPLN